MQKEKKKGRGQENKKTWGEREQGYRRGDDGEERKQSERRGTRKERGEKKTGDKRRMEMRMRGGLIDWERIDDRFTFRSTFEWSSLSWDERRERRNLFFNQLFIQLPGARRWRRVGRSARMCRQRYNPPESDCSPQHRDTRMPFIRASEVDNQLKTGFTETPGDMNPGGVVVVGG